MQYTPKTKDFFQNVFDVVRLIPKGRVTSYGAIAKYLGTAGSSRMVGWAMNAAHNVQPKVPAQRVVNRNGMLSGKAHFETPTHMEELLKKDVKKGLASSSKVFITFPRVLGLENVPSSLTKLT